MKVRFNEWHEVVSFYKRYESVSRFEGQPYGDAVAKMQLAQKAWIVESLKQIHLTKKKAYLCGGWLGLQAPSLFEELGLEQIVNVDIDPSTEQATEIVDHPGYTHCIADMYGFNYDYDSLIINTSTEHINDINNWFESLPSCSLVLLVNNNLYGVEGHVNCSSSIEEFKLKVSSNSILYESEMILPEGSYSYGITQPQKYLVIYET